MAVCAKHMRAERVRNDTTYTTKSELENYRSDVITHANGQSYLLAESSQILNGMTNLNMNAQKISNIAPGTL